ncbi:MAG: class I SAM-dependent RNA methyltransferase [Treponema sp.]|jgi:putative N6-adenine-specific DNA methylase|nr:class I SAM-dependent RNA methyltransferase [Treponema sp.]
MSLYTAAALCAVGAERVVSNELKKLKLKVLDSGFGRVRFQADIPALYLALMGLRAADRVLLEAARFPAADFDALFEGVKAVPWEEYVPKGMGLAVSKVRSRGSRLEAAVSIQAMTHKAAADRLCGAFKLRRLPEGGKTAELRVYVEKDEVSVLLDLAGDPLFKRGYRREGGAAPLRETTAAALLLLANWRRKFPLYDPFCGAGTIAIEAAMYAWDMAPGLGRRFVLSDLALGNSSIEQDVRKELLQKVDFSRTIRIDGSDADSRAVSMAKANAQRAYDLARGGRAGGEGQTGIRLPALPGFRTLAAKDASNPFPEEHFEDRPKASSSAPLGFIITNPPYGRRLGEPGSAERTYEEMAELARGFPGWKLGVISDHPGFESHFGRKADSVREITNGAVPSYFYEYEGL